MCSAGCGPAVSLASDTEADADTDDGTGDRTSGEDTSASGAGPSTANPVTTSPPSMTMTAPMPPETSSGSDASDGSSGSLQDDCWSSEPLGEAPSNLSAVIRDHDGNGTDEVWLYMAQDTETVVVATGHDGEVLGDHAFEGSFVDLADINGDGLLDIVSAHFGGGGPPDFFFSRAMGAFSFAAGLEPLELETEGAYPGFIDIVDSAATDVFLSRDEGVQLLAGLGDGIFTAYGELPLASLPVSTAIPIRGAANQAAVVPFSFSADLCDGGVTRVFASNPEFTLLAESGAQTPGGLEGPALRAIATGDGGTRVYRMFCTLDGVGVVAQLSVPGSTEMEPTVLAPDSDWATVGDLDGDGTIDVFSQRDGSVWFAPGLGDGSFQPDIEVPIPGLDVERNRLLVGDTDGDGRDEIVVVANSGSGTVLHNRVALDRCF